MKKKAEANSNSKRPILYFKDLEFLGRKLFLFIKNLTFSTNAGFNLFKKNTHFILVDLLFYTTSETCKNIAFVDIIVDNNEITCKFIKTHISDVKYIDGFFMNSASKLFMKNILVSNNFFHSELYNNF